MEFVKVDYDAYWHELRAYLQNLDDESVAEFYRYDSETNGIARLRYYFLEFFNQVMMRDFCQGDHANGIIALPQAIVNNWITKSNFLYRREELTEDLDYDKELPFSQEWLAFINQTNGLFYDDEVVCVHCGTPELQRLVTLDYPTYNDDNRLKIVNLRHEIYNNIKEIHERI